MYICIYREKKRAYAFNPNLFFTRSTIFLINGGGGGGGGGWGVKKKTNIQLPKNYDCQVVKKRI